MTDFKTIYPNKYSFRFMYTDIDGNLKISLGAFLRNGFILGIKPAIYFNNIGISVPITVCKNLSYAGFASKLIVGALALFALAAGWLSDPDEDDVNDKVENKEVLGEDGQPKI